MKENSKASFAAGNYLLSILILFGLTVHAQTGTYNQTAPNIYSVNSYTPVTFTATPFNALAGTLSFQWIACHQSSFGSSSTIYIEILSSSGYVNIGTYSSSSDCINISQNKALSASQLSDASQAGGGNIIFRFYISDSCFPGLGCASVNDPAVINISLNFPYSIADFTVTDSVLCPGESISFSDITPGTVNSRTWSFPGGTPSNSTLANPVISYASTGFYSVTLTTTGPGGSNTTTKASLIHVNSSPAAVVTAGGPVTFCSGGSVILNANTGSGLTYKWKKSGTFISNATNSSYNASSTGNYKAIISSSAGCSATSNTISVTENTKPTAIISANGPVDLCPGDSVIFQAASAGGFTYQWKKNNSSIAGATTITYSAKATGNYFCKVTNANGCSASSNSFDVVVNTPKASITLTGPATFCQGFSALLKANSGINLNYQWIRNGANISGATDSTYSPSISGNYKVKVTNVCGSSTSTNKTITVNSPPSASITSAGPLIFCSGSTVTLNANTGTGLTYQWKKNNINISGATLASYIASTNGGYNVIITNSTACSATSNTLNVTVNVTIASISASGPTTFCAGDSVKLTANNGSGLSYQWLKNNATINGATSINYSAKTAGTYKCIVTSSLTGCAALSSGIAVTVNCRLSGISTSPMFSALLSPNPFTDEFEVTFENYADMPIELELFSISGKLLSRETHLNPKINFHSGKDITPGVYLLKIKQGQESRNLRIIKN